jgi:hypothetical protein
MAMLGFNHPKTQFTRSGDLHIAYQMTGEGPLDLSTFRAGFRMSSWPGKNQLWPPFLHRLASFSRMILFDKRGTGSLRSRA